MEVIDRIEKLKDEEKGKEGAVERKGSKRCIVEGAKGGKLVGGGGGEEGRCGSGMR